MPEQVQAFAQAVASDSALQEELKLLLAYAGPLSVDEVADRVAEAARGRGFDLGADDLAQAFRANTQARASTELSDAELDAVAGGNPDDAYAAQANVVDVVAQVATTVAGVALAAGTTVTGTQGAAAAAGSVIMSRMKQK